MAAASAATSASKKEKYFFKQTFFPFVFSRKGLSFFSCGASETAGIAECIKMLNSGHKCSLVFGSFRFFLFHKDEC